MVTDTHENDILLTSDPLRARLKYPNVSYVPSPQSSTATPARVKAEAKEGARLEARADNIAPAPP